MIEAAGKADMKVYDAIAENYPTAVVPRRRDIDAAVTKCIDDYLLMERKARAWDELLLMAERDWPPLVDTMLRLVHPAQEPSKG